MPREYSRKKYSRNRKPRKVSRKRDTRRNRISRGKSRKPLKKVSRRKNVMRGGVVGKRTNAPHTTQQTRELGALKIKAKSGEALKKAKSGETFIAQRRSNAANKTLKRRVMMMYEQQQEETKGYLKELSKKLCRLSGPGNVHLPEEAKQELDKVLEHMEKEDME